MFQLKQGIRKSLSVAAVFLVLAWTQANGWADEILVSAAASLTDVLKEISSGYQAKSKHTVKFNFGPSNGLARQIEEGAPADLFFSADLPQMDTLDKNGRLEPGTRKNLLSNQLVIIVPADSKLAISSPKDLLKADIKKIALAEPSSVPVGVYSSKYLTDEGLWDQVKPKVVPGTRCPRDSGFGRVRQRRSRLRLQNRRRDFQESEDRLRSAHRQRTQDHLPGSDRQRIEAQRSGARFHELRPEPRRKGRFQKIWLCRIRLKSEDILPFRDLLL